MYGKYGLILYAPILIIPIPIPSDLYPVASCTASCDVAACSSEDTTNVCCVALNKWLIWLANVSSSTVSGFLNLIPIEWISLNESTSSRIEIVWVVCSPDIKSLLMTYALP